MFSIRYIGRILSPPRPRVKPRAFSPFVLPVLLVLFSSLTFPAPAASLTATDANGTPVTLPAPPSRILVAGKSALIPSDALFLFPEARKHLLRLARVNQGLGNFYALLAPDLASSSAADALQNGGTEELAALRPDLVLAKTAATSSVLDPLRRLGIPGFALSLETPGEWLRELPELGRLLGEEARAAELVSLFRIRLDAVQAAVSAVPSSARPRVLLLQASATDGILSFSVSPDDWLQTWLVEAAGGIPVWKGTGLTSTGWSKVSFEQIAAWNPDVIYFVSYKAPVAPLLDAVKADRRWQLLSAARTDRLRAMPADLVSWAQPVSRWILCLQWLAADLHPTAIPSFDPEIALAGFYRDFYAVPPGPVLDALLSAYRASQPCPPSPRFPAIIPNPKLTRPLLRAIVLCLIRKTDPGEPMNAIYLEKARERMPNIPLLVNVVSKRVRQLNAGHRPLLKPDTPDMDHMDLALKEIAEGKLSAELGPLPAAADQASFDSSILAL